MYIFRLNEQTIYHIVFMYLKVYERGFTNGKLYKKL